jgi:hypothetical protein
MNEAWEIVGLAVFLFIFSGISGLFQGAFGAAWLCFVGAILEIDLGVLQIHIRRVW